MEILEAEKDISTHRDAITALELRRENEARRLLGYEEEIARIRQENAETGGKIEECKAKIAELKVRAAQAAEEIEALHAKRMETEAASAALRMKEREKLEERERLSGELARLEERKNAMAEEYDEIIRKLFDEYELTRSEAEDLGIEIENAEEARKRLAELKSKIRALGSVNPEAIEEYKEVKTRFDFLTVQVEDLETTKAELTRLINQLTQQMQELFTEKFEIINKHFGKTFAELFGGGQAQLKLTDPANVLETGIEILAQPPGKSVSIIEQLSGGEKALIAIAIYFAIMKVNPPPFCVLDEVEAALDEVNVTKFAEYLRLMSVATQFIIITHR